MAFSRDRVTDGQFRHSSRPGGALGQGKFHAEAGEYGLAAVDRGAGVGGTAEIGIQRAERLEQGCFRPGVAAGVVQEFLGAGDCGVDRDGQRD